MINLNETSLGIELGSTRIKAMLLDGSHTPLATGVYQWENQLNNGIWTYPLEEVWIGLQQCYQMVSDSIRDQFGMELTTVGAIGVSAMMHGYLAFDANDQLLTPFRTWRNTITGEAAAKLSDAFGFNIPQRWSIAHLYQAILNQEPHIKNIAYIQTLAGYVHQRLTGQRVLGIGDASGMFPISSDGNYNAEMLNVFRSLPAMEDIPWQLESLLPKILQAGDRAGLLTEEGARLLDPSGKLNAGIPFCPPEGDAGTGMVATNSVRPGTGNVSAGTSCFAMIVTDRELGVHREIDMVTTPAGQPVAMVHCNNCTSDINAWVHLFGEFATLMNFPINPGMLFEKLFSVALEGDADCGGLLPYNYYSGEGVTDLDSGRPLFARTPDAKFTLANFMRSHLYSAIATLKIGLDILAVDEGIRIEKIMGHGGYFNTPNVGQRMLSAAVNAPVSVMKTAGEGGPYGMALLASYMLQKTEGESLESYLDTKVFANAEITSCMAHENEMNGFTQFLSLYKKAFSLERQATILM